MKGRLKKKWSCSSILWSHFQAKGFEMTYLEKVPEVKDTVHKQSLLHHACSVVVENFPQSTDLYSEIGAITRSAKVRLYPQVVNTLSLFKKKMQKCNFNCLQLNKDIFLE